MQLLKAPQIKAVFNNTAALEAVGLGRPGILKITDIVASVKYCMASFEGGRITGGGPFIIKFTSLKMDFPGPRTEYLN